MTLHLKEETDPLIQERPHFRYLADVPAVYHPVGTDPRFPACQRQARRSVEGPPPDDRWHPVGPVRRRPLAQPPGALRPLADSLRPLPQVVPPWLVGTHPVPPPGPQDGQRRDRLGTVLHRRQRHP